MSNISNALEAPYRYNFSVDSTNITDQNVVDTFNFVNKSMQDCVQKAEESCKRAKLTKLIVGIALAIIGVAGIVTATVLSFQVAIMIGAGLAVAAIGAYLIYLGVSRFKNGEGEIELLDQNPWYNCLKGLLTGKYEEFFKRATEIIANDPNLYALFSTDNPASTEPQLWFLSLLISLSSRQELLKNLDPSGIGDRNELLKGQNTLQTNLNNNSVNNDFIPVVKLCLTLNDEFLKVKDGTDINTAFKTPIPSLIDSPNLWIVTPT